MRAKLSQSVSGSVSEKAALSIVNCIYFPPHDPLRSLRFDESISQALNFIELTTGGRSWIPQWYRDHPPQLLLTPVHWNSYARSVISPGEPTNSSVFLRPDVILFPAVLCAVLAHEAAHMTDPTLTYLQGSGDQPGVGESLSVETMNSVPPISRLAAEVYALSAELELLDQMTIFKTILPVRRLHLEQQIRSTALWRRAERARCELGLSLLKLCEYSLEHKVFSQAILTQLRAPVITASLEAGVYPTESAELKYAIGTARSEISSANIGVEDAAKCRTLVSDTDDRYKAVIELHLQYSEHQSRHEIPVRRMPSPLEMANFKFSI